MFGKIRSVHSKRIKCIYSYNNICHSSFILPLLISLKGTYDKWTDKLINRDEPGYCAYSPYMFAFVLLLLEWVLMPIFICLVCCVICGFSMSLG